MRIPKRPTFREELALWKKGIDCVIGVDEVGRGAFAGPVVAAAVAFTPKGTRKNHEGIQDSKLLRPGERERLSLLIKDTCLSWSVAEVGVSVINRQGIGIATKSAFRKAIQEILRRFTGQQTSSFVLVDGFHVRHIRGVGLGHQKAIVRGDQLCASIAAASILAKVHRDRIMKRLSRKYPHYGFGRHKGYGTREHQKALRKYGLTKIHRTSFNLAKFL